MAVYERRYEPYEGPLRPVGGRAWVISRYAWEEFSRSRLFLASLVASHPHPVRGGKQPRILFGTQATTRPPTFVLFTSGFLEAGYRRFVERRLREEFGFAGTPVRIQLRVRTKRPRR